VFFEGLPCSAIMSTHEIACVRCWSVPLIARWPCSRRADRKGRYHAADHYNQGASCMLRTGGMATPASQCRTQPLIPACGCALVGGPGDVPVRAY
jgi:hypothetical protein